MGASGFDIDAQPAYNHRTSVVTKNDISTHWPSVQGWQAMLLPGSRP
jgi:hypothetical protein